MAETHLVELSSVQLPSDGALLREHVRKPERRTENYVAQYDRTTLFYDHVFHAQRQEHLLTGPPLLNLWPELKRGLSAGPGGGRLKLKRFRSPKYDQVRVKVPEGPLRLAVPGGPDQSVPRKDVSNLFAGRNCVVTLNKNNDLNWIYDWASHHVRLHKLQGVLIFDNRSTDYTRADLAEALSSVPGLDVAAIVDAPFRYGTTDPIKRGESRTNFLQPAMLNLARTDFLRMARAVLNVDIDEMVLRRVPRTVFDAAVARPFGAVHLPVFWGQPIAGTQNATRQAEHIYRDQPKSRTPRKWCVTPNSLMSRFGWYVHHVGGELFKLNRADFKYETVHCRATSTSWQPLRRRMVSPENLKKDDELVETFAPLLGESRSNTS